MTTINRKEFVTDMNKGGINVNDMSADNKEKLARAGVSQKDLVEIAGKDGQIRGNEEYNKLFKLLDKSDRNGSASSFETRGSDGAKTGSGKAYDALKSEVDRNIAKAQSQGVIHLGMRPASVKEADALEKANPASDGGVVRIEGYKSDGVLEYGGKTHDLKSREGLDSFRDALTSGPDKMSKEQAQKFADQLNTVKPESRDEMAQLGLSLHRAGKGELPVSRLVLSGHGEPNGKIKGDDKGEFRLTDLESLAKVFPEGAKKIEHVAVSACFIAGHSNFEDLRRTFPNLKSAFGYDEFSPAAESGAPEHLRKWEAMTDGDDPSQVDPKIHKTATWNSVDGVQGLYKATLQEVEDSLKYHEPAYLAYKNGKKDPKLATHDPKLDDYYVLLAELVKHPDVSPERKAEAETIRQEVLKLRHPELA